MTLSEHDLHEHFSEAWLTRGRDLVWRERVLDMECSAANRYMSARVQGSRTQPYPVTIRVNHSPKGWYPVGHCGCPVGYNCKHVAAVLISAWARACKQWMGCQPGWITGCSGWGRRAGG